MKWASIRALVATYESLASTYLTNESVLQEAKKYKRLNVFVLLKLPFYIGNLCLKRLLQQKQLGNRISG